ncbi:MAG: amidohydrolase family protein [Flavobacteriales bacterium]
MKLFILCLSWVFFILNGHVLSQFSPNNGVSPSATKQIAITNVDVYISPTEKMEDATILIENGKIKNIGKLLFIPDGYVIYNREGFTVLPAFIELNTDLGVEKARSSYSGNTPQLDSKKNGDFYWNESIHPEINAVSLLSPQDQALQNLSTMGFGFAVPHQHDGIVQGTGPLVALGPLTKSEQLINTEAAMFYSFEKGASNQTYPSSLMGSIALLRQAFHDLNYFRTNRSAALGKQSMEPWIQHIQKPSFFHVTSKWDILRANKIAYEFSIPMIYFSAGDEYGILEELLKNNVKIVAPINFPQPYDVSDPYEARNIPISALKHWELAPFNIRMLTEKGIPTAITSRGSTQENFWKNIRKMISVGTSQSTLLAALTTVPSAYIGADSIIGTLEKGKWASFSLYGKDPFYFETTLYEHWSLGKMTTLKPIPTSDVLGRYHLNFKTQKYELIVEGDESNPKAKLVVYKDVFDAAKNIFKKDSVFIPTTFKIKESDVILQFANPDSTSQIFLLHGKVNMNGRIWEGDVIDPQGQWGHWSAIRKFPKRDSVQPIKKEQLPIPSRWFPNMAFGRQYFENKTPIVFENVTLWTNELDGIIPNGFVTVENGVISYVGRDKPSYPKGAKVIDGKGMHLTTGIIDEHSHIAIERGVNEGGQVVAAEVNIGDVIYPEDISIYRQLAGGVTAAQLLHGSADVIGGQSGLIKLKWGKMPEEMKIQGAPGFIKCALGENVKQSNWGANNVVRFPQTRMGVEQVFYDAFYRAKAYKKEWNNYLAGNAKRQIPRVDLELEVLSQILDGKRFITCHSYVQSEINMLMKLADSFGFKINTFTHVLEGYKVADKMREHGVGGSTFADWWAYKFEVNDAIPYNAALMQKQGVTVAINSDDAEMGRRLNQEAAKTIKYGGMTEVEAWKMVTLNPAKLLHLDHRMGSLKLGKDADLVLWSTNPLSIEAKAVYTVIEGEIYYSVEQDALLQQANQQEKTRLLSKMGEQPVSVEPRQKFVKKPKRFYHCNTLGEEGSETENTH